MAALWTDPSLWSPPGYVSVYLCSSRPRLPELQSHPHPTAFQEVVLLPRCLPQPLQITDGAKFKAGRLQLAQDHLFDGCWGLGGWSSWLFLMAQEGKQKHTRLEQPTSDLELLTKGSFLGA